ncbi:Txe/YoeB family addiction module toxin [Gloeocapsopsis dulcis]|uniref:Endoribonuclease YoeB n=1 Tax=Gloeocapsopsis dulcis AAB1 = 1H9 TaxID=1433147 RepID=A0A6N8FY78_9CHRO|nr:Txe/YoeB family addiction module toxin [Gloeocapsopsis dulcis]MUL37789.1 toxin YoeB [Gloeocapsopsis dulcis AAB1 = 1H9]WNN90591.1 Txe/YoeB family addiction module toxin [Gloeocapsopsis dulcis]
MSRKIVFEASAFEDFTEWAKLDKKIHRKIVELIKDIDRSPFLGLGKPELLKYELSGFWSRRINDEHRLVYKVTDTKVLIISCKYHYV